MSNASHRDRKLSLTAAAPEIGKSLAQTSRLAAAGKIGPTWRERGQVFVTVGGIEDFLGHKISDAAQVRRTLNDTELNFLVDPGIQRLFAEMRDTDWIRHLQSHGLGPVPPPPLPDLARIEVDNQKLFRRTQVEQLLDNALRQRDRQWRDWNAADLIDKSQSPEGPYPLTLTDIKPEEKSHVEA